MSIVETKRYVSMDNVNQDVPMMIIVKREQNVMISHVFFHVNRAISVQKIAIAISIIKFVFHFANPIKIVD